MPDQYDAELDAMFDQELASMKPVAGQRPLPPPPLQGVSREEFLAQAPRSTAPLAPGLYEGTPQTGMRPSEVKGTVPRFAAGVGRVLDQGIVNPLTPLGAGAPRLLGAALLGKAAAVDIPRAAGEVSVTKDPMQAGELAAGIGLAGLGGVGLAKGSFKPITEGAKNAQTIRSDTGQVQEKGLLGQVGEEARRDDLQRQPQGQAGGAGNAPKAEKGEGGGVASTTEKTAQGDVVAPDLEVPWTTREAVLQGSKGTSTITPRQATQLGTSPSLKATAAAAGMSTKGLGAPGQQVPLPPATTPLGVAGPTPPSAGNIPHRSWGGPIPPPPPVPPAAPNVSPTTPSPSVVQQIHSSVLGFLNYHLPKTRLVNKDAASAIVRFANSESEAGALARYVPTQVLGKKWNDPDFDRLVGATLVEDQAQAMRVKYASSNDPATQAKAAMVYSTIGKPNSPFATVADYQAALRNPEVQEAIQNHVAKVKDAQQLVGFMYRQLGGTSQTPPGKVTGAYTHLIALDPQGKPYSTSRALSQGLVAPHKQASVAAHERTFLGDNYDLSYRHMMEASIKGDYPEMSKRMMYKHLLASKDKDGNPIASKTPISGYERVPVEIRGYKTFKEDLWVRKDVASELKQALQTGGKVQKNWAKAIFDTITGVQVSLGLDAAWHSVNMFAGVMGATRATPWGNIMPVRLVDSVVRISSNMVRSLRDSPELQKEMVSLYKATAGKPSFLDQPWWKKASSPGGAVINFIDKAGRMSLNQLYDDLVAHKLVESSILDRADFVAQMGEYNKRLISSGMQWWKEIGLGPFATAGKTFNALGIRHMIGSPGAETTGWGSEAYLRMNNLISHWSARFVFPIVGNLQTTGTLTGRPGTPPGFIDTGRDLEDGSGRHWVIDPNRASLALRGERIVGAQAVSRGIEKGEPSKMVVEHAGKDVLAGLLHPFLGPAVNALSIMSFGQDVGGFNKVKPGESRFVDAIESINPVLTDAVIWSANKLMGTSLKAREGRSAVESYLGALGIRPSDKPQRPKGKPVSERPKSNRPKKMSRFSIREEENA